MTKDYKADLGDAVRELLSLSAQRETLEISIAKQKKRVAALYELVEADEGGRGLSGLVEGISDACRSVFRAAEKPLLPAEVRDRVQALGLPPQANLLASIHTTIKRMKDGGELTEETVPLQTGGTGTAYRWNALFGTWDELLKGLDFAKVYGEAASGNQVRQRRPFGSLPPSAISTKVPDPPIPDDHPIRKLAARPKGIGERIAETGKKK